MSVDLDVDADWDIDEDLDNKENHYRRALDHRPMTPGHLYVALCGALVRAKGGIFPSVPPEVCPDCRANDPWR